MLEDIAELSHEQAPLDLGASFRRARWRGAVPCERELWGNKGQAETQKNNRIKWKDGSARAILFPAYMPIYFFATNGIFIRLKSYLFVYKENAGLLRPSVV